jgi:hypothetical protein
MPAIDHKSAIFFESHYLSLQLAALANAEKFDEITRDGRIIVGTLNRGGLIEMIQKTIRIAKFGINEKAQTLLAPVAARRDSNDSPDDSWPRMHIEILQGRGGHCIQSTGGMTQVIWKSKSSIEMRSGRQRG